jgi:hypothetical protein
MQISEGLMGSSWASVISWILVIAGWFIVNRQSNHRETRKEIRTDLIDFYRFLDGIEEAAFKYHTQGADELLARRIKRDIATISHRIYLIQRKQLQCEWAGKVMRMRQAVTMTNFDSSTYVRRDTSDPIFDEIAVRKANLIGCLDTAFMAKFL